ncbi:MAG: hypothetical protein Q8O99_01525 [bacterium]|nr:hypothetical protein [bacterium]
MGKPTNGIYCPEEDKKKIEKMKITNQRFRSVIDRKKRAQKAVNIRENIPIVCMRK